VDDDGVRDIVVPTANGQLNVLSAVGERPTSVEGFPFHTQPVAGLQDVSEQTSGCDPSSEPSGACLNYRGAPAYTAADGVDLDAALDPILTAPAVADLTGDGLPELVFTTYAGRVYVLRNDATVLEGWPQRLPPVPACPAGSAVASAPCRGPGARVQQGALASPVLADLDGDGRLDIVQAGLDGYLHVYRIDGSSLPGWPVRIHYPTADEDEEQVAPGRVLSTPAVGDFDGDGALELLVGSNERLGTRGAQGGFYLVDARGQSTEQAPYLPNWPVSVTSFPLLPLLAEGTPAAPAAADFDGNGYPEAVLHGNGSDPFILPADPGLQNPPGSLPARALPERQDPETGQPSRGLEPTRRFGADSRAQRVETVVPLFGQPAVGDLNRDGVPDVVTAGTYLDVAQALSACTPPAERAAYLLGMWDGKTGAMLPGSPVPIEDLALLGSQAIADISGDGYPEVLVGSAGYTLHAIDACGREPDGWPKFAGQWIWATPAVGDVDGDGYLDVVAITRGGWLYAWRTEAPVDAVIVEWESFHHDNRNTGNLHVPLDQGATPVSWMPLPLSETGSCLTAEQSDEQPTPPPSLTATGGCRCASPGQRSTQGWAAHLALAAAALGRWRRRRKAPGVK
jgi:hypothetical protein